MTARVLSVDAEHPDRQAIAEAAAVIQAGGLVAFPTETVYGLGANALDPVAVERIFAAKGRPADDPLIVHVASVDGLAEVADLTGVGRSAPLEMLAALARRFWPGPLTLVLPRGARVPTGVTAGRDTVAVRVPDHPIARALIEAAGRPIAAPSANLFARPSPTIARHVLADLAERIDLVLDGGPTRVGIESTVLDLTRPHPRVLRPGGVTSEQLRDVLGQELDTRPVTANDPASPGTAERHYSPRARVDLFEQIDAAGLAAHARARAAAGERVGVLLWDDDASDVTPVPGLLIEPLGPREGGETAARRLYAALRSLDDRAADVVVVRMPEPIGLGSALRDRLRRAASGRVLDGAGRAS
jgi:L-threonylcarbamoyladenylate synthase